jgi:hypothetical protein
MTRMEGYSFGDIDRTRMTMTTLSPWTQDDRNNLIAMSYSDRPTIRDCPMNRPGRSLREPDIVPAQQQPRRRIALAVRLLVLMSPCCCDHNEHCLGLHGYQY